MPDLEIVRWRVKMILEVSVTVLAPDRQGVVDRISDIDFETFKTDMTGDLEFEITDHEYADIDPEPLCKCGRLPECCDCDE